MDLVQIGVKRERDVGFRPSGPFIVSKCLEKMGQSFVGNELID